MLTTRLSSKGQMIVPKKIRDRLAIKPGAELAVELIGDDERGFTVRVKTGRSRRAQVDALAGALHRSGRKPLSPQDMAGAVLGIAAAEDARTKPRRRAR